MRLRGGSCRCSMPKEEAQSSCEDVWRREQPAWRGLTLQSLGATCPQALSLLIL